MIVDKKGKLFGKISVLDLIVLLVIIVAIAGCVYKFGPGKTGGSIVSGSDTTINMVIKTGTAREYSANAIQVGDALYEVHGDKIGTITDVRVEQAKEITDTHNGNKQYIPMENRYVSYITVEIKGTVTEKGYFVNGNKQFSKGNSLSFETPHVTYQDCRIYSMEEAK
ncbi:MAG: DUF4330 domain-containing protein [Bacillota bacterium]|nr:DUF4330 domain-containing protein [Bacillota bacterium]